jgi:hypothetical protein
MEFSTMRFFLGFLPVLALHACATPESQIKTSLLGAGLSKPVATCMADKMTDRLTIKQLLRLRSLSSLQDKKLGSLSVAEFLRRTRALGDPGILEIVTSAGLGCAFSS